MWLLRRGRGGAVLACAGPASVRSWYGAGTGPLQGGAESFAAEWPGLVGRLGLLDTLPVEATRTIRRFNFCRAGGERLCTVDYGDLPAPYNRAVVTLPNVAHHAILDALEKHNPGALWYDATFTGLRFDGSRVIGLQAERHGEPCERLATIGRRADVAFSKAGLSRPYPQLASLFGRVPPCIIDAPHVTRTRPLSGGQASDIGIFPAPEPRSMCST